MTTLLNGTTDDAGRQMPGQIIARGVCRYLRDLGWSAVEELVPTPGLRVDVMALGPKCEVWIVECKSSRADFMSDRKWYGYLPWCDRFSFAVDGTFPVDVLPREAGLIVADGYGAAETRAASERPLSPARRRKMVHTFARHAALRLQAARDPACLSGAASL